VGGMGPSRGEAPRDTLTSASAGLAAVMTSLQSADVRPTTVQLNAIAAARATADRLMTEWAAMKSTDLVALNTKLKAAGLRELRP
jgi:hypothetical protein